MASKSVKTKQIYDRGVIACLEEEPVFSYVPFDMELDDNITFSQAMATKLNVKKKIEEKRWTTPVNLKMDGETKTVYYFARVEDEFPFFRLEAALRLLNDEINKWPYEEREEIYRTHMVDNFFEKMTSEFHYEKKNPETHEYDFTPWDKVSTRFGKKPEQPSLTDDNPASDMEIGIAQKSLRPRTKKGIEAAAESSREAAAIIAADLDKKLADIKAAKEKAEQMRIAKEEAAKEAAEALEYAAKLAREADQAEAAHIANAVEALASAVSVQDLTFGTQAAPGESVSGSSQETSTVNVFDKAFMTQTSIIDTTAAQQEEAQHVPSTSADPSATFVAPSASSSSSNDKNNNSPPETSAAGVSMSDHDAMNYTFMAPADVGTQPTLGPDDVLFSVGSHDNFITQNFLKAELTKFFSQLQDLIRSESQSVKDEFDDKYKKLDKKIDNKFANVLEMKKDIKGMSTKLVGVTEQVARNSPKKSLSYQIQTSSRGRYILLRLIPFNMMGKACDVFFASPFVQEQLCAFLTPHLHKMQFAGINFALAKTCIITFFTPEARAHLIYGKIENSVKNLLFYKRALPDGLHNMVDKFLVLVIEEMLSLAPNVHRDHITDMRGCCTTTFTTDRARFLQLAVDSFATVAEAAHAVAEEDFKYYEANKHCLKKSGKAKTNIASFNEHVQYLLNRQQFKEAKKQQDDGNFKQSHFPENPENVFDDLRRSCVMEEMDVKEVLRRICAAAYCFNLDYTQLEFDNVPNVPELPRLYQEVVQEINGNINDLLAKYSSEGAAYQPNVFVGNISSSPTKRPGQGKSASASTSAASSESGKTLTTNVSRSLSNQMLTDSENEDDDNTKGSSVSTKRKRPIKEAYDRYNAPPSKRRSPISPTILPPELQAGTSGASPAPSIAPSAGTGKEYLTSSSEEGASK